MQIYRQQTCVWVQVFNRRDACILGQDQTHETHHHKVKMYIKLEFLRSNKYQQKLIMFRILVLKRILFLLRKFNYLIIFARKILDFIPSFAILSPLSSAKLSENPICNIFVCEKPFAKTYVSI